jgi:hypothetical protein
VLEGQKRAPGYVNILRGRNRAGWRTRLPRHAQVVYRELWRGVDLALRGQAGKLKYEFRVRPGARIEDIRLAYRGATGLELDGAGALRIETPLGALRDSTPVAYQEIGGVHRPIASRYLLDGRSYGFAVVGYDRGRELVIDPGLDYSTFLGGASHEVGAAIAVDASGNAYVTGLTQSPDFRTTAGAFDRTGASGNNLDAFVTKLNPTGTALVYSTFLGGSNFEWGRGIAVDAAGNAYVTGQTKSSNFPTTGGAFDRTFNVDNCPRCGIDQYDAFVTKLNSAGSGLVYSTFLGGTQLDDSLGIALDGARNAYVTGQTASTNFPTTGGAFDTTASGGFDAFITKLNAAGSALVYSTRLGGADNELPADVEVDAAGNAYVGGGTRSAGFPTTPGAFDTTQNGGAFDELFDGFVTKLNATGSALVYSTFVGGSKSDFGDGFAVDSAGNAYLTGATLSPDFPTTPGTFDPVFAGGSEGFVSKLNATGSALVYSTFLGEAGASAVAPDAGGNAWVAGATGSPNATTTPDAFDRQFNGGASDAYVAKLNATGSALLFATFLGGANSEGAGDVVLDSGGNVYVTGHTYSADFPTTAGAFDRVFNGDPSVFWGDAFVTKLAVGSGSPAPPPAPPPASPPPAPPPPPPPPAPPPPPPASLAAPSLVSPAHDARFPPGQTITFDWTDVTGASTYTIQIDDSDSFAAPFMLNQTVGASQLTTSTLPTTRMWWRVRANDASGAPGAWSAVRRFELKN